MGYRVAERKPELKVLYFVIVPPIKMIDTCKPKYLFCRLLYKLIRTITTGICFLSILARRFQTVILMLIQLIGGFGKIAFTSRHEQARRFATTLKYFM